VEEPVVEFVPEPVVEEPVVEFVPEPVVEEPVVEETPTADRVEFSEHVIDESPAIAASEPAIEPFRPAVVVEHFHPFDVPSLDDGAEENMFEVEDAPVPVASGPAARWAAMMPGGSTQPTVNPMYSWSRLQPGAVVAVPAPAAASPATASSPAPQAMPAAPGLAWWDVPAPESDPRRGRFALGGYALQAGHQVVSGVTFRDGVVPPPSHWVIGPVTGPVAPGTLVLEVEGCLNCTPGDLEVLMEHGFAPTPEGFSLRLTAAATGPFAASGTFVVG
jgi:hypothetical protein